MYSRWAKLAGLGVIAFALTLGMLYLIESLRRPQRVRIASPYAFVIPPLRHGEVVIAAGDIADCDHLLAAEVTAKMLDQIPGTVLTLGDSVYPKGSLANYQRCFDATWGRHKQRIHPAPGNHDYYVPAAADYFEYFGPLAGETGIGYYSFDVGAWHIISLNSQCRHAGGCEAGSKQEQWLREDLKQNAGKCIIAYWHAPLFSSGKHGHDVSVKPFWDDLYAAGADIVLNGHDHDYERFAPQNPEGQPDKNGIREFVVGTGGSGNRVVFGSAENSEERSDNAFGVLRLVLRPEGYDWDFIPVDRRGFSDSGSGQCRNFASKNLTQEAGR